jgi:hypothetical protein
MSVLNKVQVRWAAVLTPDTKFEPTWHVTVVLDEATKKQLIDESKSVDPKGKGIKIKEDDEGNLVYRFRRKVMKADGSSENNPPLVCGPKGKDDKFDKLIGNGSVCNIQYRFVPYNNKFGSGVTCDLQGVQVLEHVPFGEQDGDAFGSVESSSEEPKSSNEYDDSDF